MAVKRGVFLLHLLRNCAAAKELGRWPCHCGLPSWWWAGPSPGCGREGLLRWQQPPFPRSPELLREGRHMREEGRRESSLAVSSQLGPASGPRQGSAGRWRVARRGCITHWAGGHRCLSLVLCWVLVALCFACLLELFWGRLSTTPSTHSRTYYGYPCACENGDAHGTPKG